MLLLPQPPVCLQPARGRRVTAERGARSERASFTSGLLRRERHYHVFIAILSSFIFFSLIIHSYDSPGRASANQETEKFIFFHLNPYLIQNPFYIKNPQQLCELQENPKTKPVFCNRRRGTEKYFQFPLKAVTMVVRLACTL